MKLFDDLEASPLEADQGSFNALLDAVRDKPARARDIFEQGMERGFYADLEFLQGSTTCLDLHYMSDGAAEAAVRWWLDERSTGSATQRLDVITGWGKSRPVYKDSDIRATWGSCLMI